MKKDVAIVVLNYIQYLNIIPGIKELIKEGYKVDFYCSTSSDAGFNNLFSDVKDLMEKEGFNVYSTEQDIDYKVLLEPYPSGLNIKAKYKIRYKYSNISAKPNKVYKPENYIGYDAILCSGEYDYNILRVFTQPYITGNQKYIDFKKKKSKKTKKVLLYLPTYGEESSIDIIHEKLAKLREKYYVIAKIHHGTSFLSDEVDRIQEIKESVDEYYDLHKELSELLERADVVLTDNSGALFEAIYTEVPVAVFTDDINKNKKEGFDTTQYELYKKGILPYTSDINKIDEILEQALSKEIINLQKEWNRKNLYHPKDLLIDFVNVIKNYINDNIDERYYEMHNILKNDYFKTREEKDYKQYLLGELEKDCLSVKEKLSIITNEIKVLENEKKELLKENKKLKEDFKKEKEQLLKENKDLKNSLEYYENGKLYKAIKKIYEIKNGR